MSPAYTPTDEEELDLQREERQQRLEQLRQDKERLERERERVTELQQRRSAFVNEQNELGQTLVDAVDLIKKELESLRAEGEELESVLAELNHSIQNLSTVRPDEWPVEKTDDLIRSGQPVIDRCENDFAAIKQQCAHMRHTKVLSGMRRSRRVWLTGREFVTQFLQGLSFHLPLAIIVLIVLVIIHFMFR